MEHLKIIGLLGKARAGKDTVGKMLCEIDKGAIMAYADKLKQIVVEMFEAPLEDLYTPEGKDKKTTFDSLLCPECHSTSVELLDIPDSLPKAACKLCGTVGDRNVFASKWTNRTILQYLGTEGFRKIDPNVWVRYALKQARQHLSVTENKFVVITDCRFKSEASAILAVGGEVWRVKRPETDVKVEGIKGHASETEQESITDGECQAVIKNDGTLENLRGLVVAQLHRFLAKY